MITSLVAAIVIGGASGLDLQASGDMPSNGAAVASVDETDIYVPPSRGLDERIKAEKITEQDPPALPERLMLPLPASHRIATEAGQVPISEEHWQKANEAITKALEYLRSAQDETGGWMVGMEAIPTDQPESPSPIAVAVTALVVKAMVQSENGAANTNEVRRAVMFMMRARNEGGSFEGGALTNYVTSIVVSALSGLKDPRFRGAVDEGTAWLQAEQWDQSEGLSSRQDWFGGAGYGDRGRPDLSNTQMMLEALYDAGMSPDEPAFQKALAFLSRTQNLQAVNKSEWAGDDGGFVYTCANGGESMASERAGEGRYGEKIAAGEARALRSYGSMTYAGFKSLLYAGLSADDIRVRAAFDWVRRHWTFDENPGVGGQGLYYYYHAMSRALRIAQQHTIADAVGTKHNWREELIDAIVARQGEDGSWRNDADRWMEAEPELATAYSVLALEEALKPVSGMGE